MKMADNSLLTFQNNCESINRNGVEVKANRTKDNDTDNITALRIIINKPDDQPQGDVLQNSSDVLSQEDVVDEFLAGENKPEYNNDLLLLSNIDNDNEGISFKSENTISECNNGEMGKSDFPEPSLEGVESSGPLLRRISTAILIANKLKRRSIKCLNKMQIMEDVREGCNVQPSSPGHAEEQRSDNDAQVKTETHTENGYGEQNSNNENIEENSEDQKEDAKPSESEGEVADTIKTEFPDANNLNDESCSNASSPSAESSKRKSDNEDFPIKRLRTDLQDNFASRDKILNEFFEMADCNNLEQIQAFSEQLLSEIKVCNELAKDKEREWNSIIHLKKIKEELLLRMQRKRQIMLLNEKSEYLDLPGESQGENSDDRLSGSPHSILKSNLTHPQKSGGLRIPNFNVKGDKSKHRNILPKLPQNAMELNGSLDLRQGKQRPVLDVQSIIADYRQRHPEAVPRRGRRIRNSQSDSSNKSSILNISSMALGSGSQVRQNLQGVDMSNELGLLLSSMNGNRTDLSKSMSGDSSAFTMQDTTSFKDMLLQFARLSQSERNELIQNAIKPPPPYPEVTVHPVPTTTAPPTNSLLHGILTKSPTKQNSKSSFSPTLARLLTAPERAANNHATSTPTMTNSTTIHPANMSISEILSTSKARNEITITPVGTQYETSPNKGRSTEEEEAEDSADRLVIDESTEAVEARRAADNNSEAGDDVPPCQGCNQRPAQFVCAGCGNQWYCSRDCQVSAWDEHSEVCSG